MDYPRQDTTSLWDYCFVYWREAQLPGAACLSSVCKKTRILALISSGMNVCVVEGEGEESLRVGFRSTNVLLRNQKKR